MGFLGLVGHWSGWVMGQWSVGQWMVGVMSYQKIYGLNSVKCHKVEMISGWVGFGWVWWIWWVRVGDGLVVSGWWVTSAFRKYMFCMVQVML